MSTTIQIKDGINYVVGSLDESLDLLPWYRTTGRLKISFRHVPSLNSIGLSKLLNFVLSRVDLALEYHECPAVMLDAFEQVPRLLGQKEDPSIVKSLFVPYWCDACRKDSVLLVPFDKKGMGRDLSLPPAGCSGCGVLMRLQKDPEDLFAFAERF